MNFYISDLHIGHENCLEFDKRPFKTLDDMHKVIIENWNKVVNENDSVYVLGDFAWKNGVGLEVLKQLKGKKHLVLGNHDKLNASMEKHFVTIDNLVVINDGDKHLVLCHYPIAHWQSADYGYIHLHGHIHEARDSRPFEEYKKMMKNRLIPYECYNVGCMLHNYTPVTLEQILKKW